MHSLRRNSKFTSIFASLVANDFKRLIARVGLAQRSTVLIMSDWLNLSAAEQERLVQHFLLLDQRHSKRRHAIARMKNEPPYKFWASKGRTSEMEPDPDDVGISKRNWEKAVGDWRGALKQFYAEHNE